MHIVLEQRFPKNKRKWGENSDVHCIENYVRNNVTDRIERRSFDRQQTDRRIINGTYPTNMLNKRKKSPDLYE